MDTIIGKPAIHTKIFRTNYHRDPVYHLFDKENTDNE
jgi:hypothetical protein